MIYLHTKVEVPLELEGLSPFAVLVRPLTALQQAERNALVARLVPDLPETDAIKVGDDVLRLYLVRVTNAGAEVPIDTFLSDVLTAAGKAEVFAAAERAVMLDAKKNDSSASSPQSTPAPCAESAAPADAA